VCRSFSADVRTATTIDGSTFGGYPPFVYDWFPSSTIEAVLSAAASTVLPVESAAPTVAPISAPVAQASITPAASLVSSKSSATKASAASLARRQNTQPTAPQIPGVLLIRTQMLVVSPVAIFFSIAILAFLAVSTVLVFIVQRHDVELLPRDVESSASILAFVYASKKLQAWARERHETGQWDDGEGSRISWAMFKEILGQRPKYQKGTDDGTEISMGHFGPGDEHWGVEIDATPAKKSLRHSELYEDYFRQRKLVDKSNILGMTRDLGSSSSQQHSGHEG
jgi:hypothetical protein